MCAHHLPLDSDKWWAEMAFVTDRWWVGTTLWPISGHHLYAAVGAVSDRLQLRCYNWLEEKGTLLPA